MACPLAFKVENLSEGVELLWRKYEEEVRKIEASEPPLPPMVGGNWVMARYISYS